MPFPRYSAVQRMTVYAVVGGVPAYLRTFDDSRPVDVNIRQRILSELGLFLNEPYLLIQDEIKQPRNHLAVLQAIGAGQRQFSDIARAACAMVTRQSAPCSSSRRPARSPSTLICSFPGGQ